MWGSLTSVSIPGAVIFELRAPSVLLWGSDLWEIITGHYNLFKWKEKASLTQLIQYPK